MSVESDAEATRVGVPPPRWSVFGAVAGWTHLHELRIELAEDFDQVGLRGHDGVDVLIDTRHFIEDGGDQLDAAPNCYELVFLHPPNRNRQSADRRNRVCELAGRAVGGHCF